MIIGKDIKKMLVELERAQTEERNSQEPHFKESRNFKRSRVVWEAKLKVFFNEVTLKGELREVSGVVRDISANGAKVDLAEPLQNRNDLELQIPKLGTLPCEIVWQKENTVGIRFKESPDVVFSHLSKVLPKA